MKKRISFILVLQLIIATLNAQNKSDNWPTYSIPNVCSFKIPTTMEMRQENSFHGQFVKSMQQSSFFEMLCDECDLFLDKTKIVIQPKGLNSDPNSNEYKKANNSYGRIIISFEYNDLLSQEDVKSLTPSELTILDTMWRNEVKEGLDCLGKYSGFKGSFTWTPLRKEYYSGLAALVTEYNRPGTDGETHVREYKFFYNEKILLVTTSYNMQQEEKYRDDFQSFIRAFTIETKAESSKPTPNKKGSFVSKEYNISFSYNPNKFTETKKMNKTSHCFFKLEADDEVILFSAWDLKDADLIPIHDDDYVEEMRQADRKIEDATIIESCTKIMIGNKKALRSVFSRNVLGVKYTYTSYRAYHKDRFYTVDFHIPTAKYNKKEVDNMIKDLQFK